MGLHHNHAHGSHASHAHHGHGGHAHHGHGAAGHDHPRPHFSRAFLIGIVLNGAFAGTEAVIGLLSGSMALIADAGHNLSDVLGLILAWGGATLAKRPPSERFTYGLSG
jgi:cobalt-zinc-cadmium efflux system protein